MYPKTLKPHLRASMAAAWLFGIALGYWLADQPVRARPKEREDPAEALGERGFGRC